MKIATTKQPDGAYLVTLDGRSSPLFIAYDSSMQTWDLVTETEYIMSAASKGAVLARLVALASIIIKAAG